MEKIIVSDFDGTITAQDTLYSFFKTYAQSSWLDIEAMWAEGKIGSMECLKRQFELVENLSEDLIEKYISGIKLDRFFKDFINKIDCDFVVVSDGVDYFINKVFQNMANLKTENLSFLFLTKIIFAKINQEPANAVLYRI